MTLNPNAPEPSQELEPSRPRGQGMSWLRLLFFEWSQGHAIAIRCFLKGFGLTATVRLLTGFAWRMLISDPFRKLRHQPPRKLTRAERMSRYQMKPVLLLNETLKAQGYDQDTRKGFLKTLVGQSGAAFIRFNMPTLDAKIWRALSKDQQNQLAEGILDRFFNMDAARVTDPSADFGFNVKACHFASLAQQLGVPELAEFFCHADSVYFSDPAVPIDLIRDQTLAGGGACCAFRFRLKADGSSTSDTGSQVS